MNKKSKSELAQKILKDRGLSPAEEGEVAARMQDVFVPGEDEVNPFYLFSGTHVDLLLRLANGQFDLLQMAKDEVANRGLNLKGEWIGWKKGTI